MKMIRLSAAGTALFLAAGLAFAQPGPGAGPGRGPGGPHWGKDYTPGWSMMSRAEREEHREKMQSLKTYEECRAFMDQHHQLMQSRAKENGRTIPATPRRDGCRGLPKSAS